MLRNKQNHFRFQSIQFDNLIHYGFLTIEIELYPLLVEIDRWVSLKKKLVNIRQTRRIKLSYHDSIFFSCGKFDQNGRSGQDCVFHRLGCHCLGIVRNWRSHRCLVRLQNQRNWNSLEYGTFGSPQTQPHDVHFLSWTAPSWNLQGNHQIYVSMEVSLLHLCHCWLATLCNDWV